MKNLLFSLILFTSFVSCGGDTDNNPVLTITSGENITLNAGEEFDVSGTATDDIELTNVLFDSNGLGISYSILGFELDTNPNFTVTFISDASTPSGQYELSVIAKDNESQTTEKIITITVN